MEMQVRGWSGRVLGMMKVRYGSTWPGCSRQWQRAASISTTRRPSASVGRPLKIERVGHQSPEPSLTTRFEAIKSPNP